MYTRCLTQRAVTPATLAHKEERNAKNGRSKSLGANMRLANAKSSVLQDYNPDAACTYAMYVHILLICEEENTQHGTAQHCAALLSEMSRAGCAFFLFTVFYVALRTSYTR